MKNLIKKAVSLRQGCGGPAVARGELRSANEGGEAS